MKNFNLFNKKLLLMMVIITFCIAGCSHQDKANENKNAVHTSNETTIENSEESPNNTLAPTTAPIKTAAITQEETFTPDTQIKTTQSPDSKLVANWNDYYISGFLDKGFKFREISYKDFQYKKISKSKFKKLPVVLEKESFIESFSFLTEDNIIYVENGIFYKIYVMDIASNKNTLIYELRDGSIDKFKVLNNGNISFCEDTRSGRNIVILNKSDYRATKYKMPADVFTVDVSYSGSKIAYIKDWNYLRIADVNFSNSKLVLSKSESKHKNKGFGWIYLTENEKSIIYDIGPYDYHFGIGVAGVNQKDKLYETNLEILEVLSDGESAFFMNGILNVNSGEYKLLPMEVGDNTSGQYTLCRPDGKSFVYCALNHSINIVNLESKKIWLIPGSFTSRGSWSKSGKKFLFENIEDNGIYLVTLQ